MSKEIKLKDLFLLDKPKNKWICQVKIGQSICGQELANTGNTSGRLNHIKYKHKQIELAKPKTNPKTTQSDSASESPFKLLGEYSHDSLRGQKLNQAVLEFIINTSQPIKMLKVFDGIIKG